MLTCSFRGSSVALMAPLLIGFTLTGCSGVVGPGGSSAPSVSEDRSVAGPISPAPSTSEAPPATPTRSAVDLHDPTAWTVTFDGIGPLILGDALSAPVTSSLTEDAPATACRSFTARGIDSIIVAPVAGIDTIGVLYLSSGDPTGRPATEEGVGVGSSEQELLAAYPDAVLTTTEISRAYTISDGDGRYIHFGMSEKTVGGVYVQESAELPIELCG